MSKKLVNYEKMLQLMSVVRSVLKRSDLKREKDDKLLPRWDKETHKDKKFLINRMIRKGMLSNTL